MNNSINILEPRSIKELLGKSFYVESYQRGYRWSDEDVKALLDDINTFANKEYKAENETYWLQPIIVKKVENIEVKECYELIDGQQRLTTIFLILNYLKNEKFEINYNTRTSSKMFLEKINVVATFDNWESYINQNREDDKIDNFHFFNAFKIIHVWFNSKTEDNKNHFLVTLLEQTKIIWYELIGDNLDPKMVFEQINIGKIPLTNAELVKALYLNSTTDEIRKDEIAEKWDRIEYALNDNSFWAFISNNVDLAHNRIGYLLDLISCKYDESENKEERLHTFLYFKADDKDLKWKKVEEYFHTLLGWYETPELFHYIGYLIATGYCDINSLIKKYNQNHDKPKKAFIDETKKLISDKIKKYNIEDLSYEQNYNDIKNILLLFNIQTTLSTTPYNYFPFQQYKEKKWSLEHIHAQQSESLKDSEAVKAWIGETKCYVEKFVDDNDNGTQAKELIKAFNYALNLGNNIKLGDLPQKVYTFFQGDSEDNAEDIHSISNMALLDKDTNSSLNNSIFPVKRRKIFDAERDNKAFIPVCTKNVFLKYYTDDISHMQFWGRADKDNYLKKIKECLKPFMQGDNQRV